MSNDRGHILQSTNSKDRIGATKVPLSLIPLSAQIHAALAHFDGAQKYQAWNWRKETVAASIYVDAALRHIQKWFQGEEKDRDSGIHHLGHALACLNIILDAQAYGNLVDDRPPADGSPVELDAAREEVLRLIKLRGKDVPSTPPITEKVQTDEPDPELFDHYDPSICPCPNEDDDLWWAGFDDPSPPRPVEPPIEMTQPINAAVTEVSTSTCDRIYFEPYTETVAGALVEHLSPQSGRVNGRWMCDQQWANELAGLRSEEELAELDRIRRNQNP